MSLRLRWIWNISICFMSLLTAGHTLAQQPGSAPSVSAFIYPHDPSHLLVRYDRIHALIARPDPIPLLRIYGDGRVLVHYPAYMKRAGDYQIQLDAAEVQTLLTALEASSLPGMNRQGVKERKAQIETFIRSQTGESFEASETTRSLIELHVMRRNVMAAAGQSSAPVHFKMSLDNVRSNAQKYPFIAEFPAMDAVETLLQTIMERALSVAGP